MMRSFLAAAVAVAVLSPAALAQESSRTARSSEIHWRSGTAVFEAMDSRSAAAKLEQLADGVPKRHAVVQFGSPKTPAQLQTLRRHGITLLQSLGQHAWYATIHGARLNARGALAELDLVHVHALRREWKVSPMILSGDIPDWAVVDYSDADDPIVAAYALFHRDVTLANGERLARSHGADVRSHIRSVNGLVIEMPLSRLTALADEDALMWIEPPLPQLSEMNDSNRIVTQANSAQGAPYNLDGSGVNVLVFDAGTALSTHSDFGGRLTVRDSSGLNNHPTHVSGTIGGDGSQSSGQFRGMAPGVTIQSYGFEFGGGGIFLYTDPGDIETDYSEAINTYGVDISNNSIGTNTATNGFPCDITGDYNTTSSLIDSIVRGSLGEPFRIIWANGNERQSTNCGNTYNTTAPPACAKNHITVGAINSNDESMTSFSSWGPCDDGRIKPDIAAPGCQSNDDGAVTSTSSSGGYTTACGTSMACPTVTGLSALLLEDFRAQNPGEDDPWNSMLKVMLAHNAADLGNSGPDYQFGYGSVRITDSIDAMRGGSFIQGEVGQGESFPVIVNVPPGTPELKITLAWDDAPATPGVTNALVNDLDIVALSPSAVQSFPWTLNPASPATPAVQNQADRTNNIEQVQVSAPQSGLWSIDVSGFDVPEGPQRFSIMTTPALLAMSITLPNGVPELLSPQAPTAFTVKIDTVAETVVGGSPTLHYRYTGGAFQTAALTPLGGDLYEASLPPPACADSPEFYVSARGATLGTVTQPSSAPASVFTAGVGDLTIAFSDDFQTNNGWSTSNDAGLTAGAWELGVPVDCDRGDPPTDFDGSGQCFLTENDAADCNSDIDGGSTLVTSPAFDLSSLTDPQISYARWYNNTAGDSPESDILVVEISDDNGSNWTTLEVVGPSGSDPEPNVFGGWQVRSFRVADFVGLTSQVRLRFNASDLGAGSVVEAAFDDLQISDLTCAGEPCEDPCDDGNPCTLNDACLGFACVGTAVDCSGFSDQCNNASCDGNGAEGNCDLLTPVANGTACDDSDPCNLNESCQAGACGGGAAPDCSGAGDQCNNASCDPAGNDGNCELLSAVANGSACDDSDPCNINEACQGGLCSGGSAPDCAAGADECTAAACSAAGAEGNCDSVTPANDGSACGTGDGVCDSGGCVEVRMFLAHDGQQNQATTLGETNVFLGQGSTVTVMAWMEDLSGDINRLNAYQIMLPDTATPLPGSTGSVTYLNVNPGAPGGDSILVDTERADWAFAGEIPLPPSYNESKASSLFGVFYSTIQGTFVEPAGNGVLYLAEFRLQASPDADGDFEMRFNLAPDAPPHTSLFNEFGASYATDLFETLTITVGEVSCTEIADCADLNGDGVRDDGCLWWQCVASACQSTDVLYADLGGPFGECPPDETTDANDRFHALNCFSNLDTFGNTGYPCADNPPATMNVDAAGLNEPCSPDGVCDGNDAFAALNAFDGTTTCSCPLDGGGPAPDSGLGGKPVEVDRAAIRLLPGTAALQSGETVEVHVLIENPLVDLRGYQLHVAVFGGDHGRLELVDLAIQPRKDHVFEGLGDWRAFNVVTAQLLCGLDTAGVQTPPTGYLATLTLRATDTARGTFVVDLLHDASDSSHRTILFPTAANGRISIDATQPAVIEVAPPTRR